MVTIFCVEKTINIYIYVSIKNWCCSRIYWKSREMKNLAEEKVFQLPE
jgi:hypothetical protein